MLKDWRVLAVCVGVAVLLLVADPVLYERLTSVFTKVDTSSEMRLAFWESTVAMIQDHPFLGIGWGAYWMVYPEYDFYLQGADIRIVHAHNMYLNYAAEIGVPGMLAFMWLFFGSLFTALRQKFAAPQPVIPAPTPFDYNEDAAADVELKKVADSVQVEEEKTETPIWQDFIEWPDWRLLAGASAGLGLALISIALNGLTDHLLFNIPSSMFLWLMLAFIAAVAELKREKDAESAAEAEKEADATREVPAFLEAELKAEDLPKVQSEVQPEEQEAEPVSAEKETEAEAAPEESTETDGAEAEEIIEKEEAGTDEKSDNHIKGDH
jgi:putative inorganic carbon (HCO3(-)) transporter